MESTEPLVFGACRLDLRRRELQLNGLPQAVAAKVFDLIVLLLDRRHRVVTKDELLAALWSGQVVSDGAIARTVMQARKAVGDGQLIKTVHGVGYRFMGELASAAPASAGRTAPGAFRLGLLPVDNRTGETSLDWTELGLAAMTVHGLEAVAGLSILTLPEMLTALAPLRTGAAVAEKIDAATRLFGLQGCVHAVLRRQGNALWLDFQGHGEQLGTLAGSLRGDDAAELGAGLAHEIRAGLAPSGAPGRSPVSQDPFVNQAYARAAQMQAMLQFRAAAKLLAVVIEFEPASLPARLAHLMTLANLEDPGTDGLAAELAALAAARGDARTQAKALVAAAGALALAEGPGGLVLSAQRLESALQLARPFEGEDWAVRIHLVVGWVALLRGQLALARDAYARVRAATAPDNQFQLALALDGQAALEGECGETLKAHDLLERSAQIHILHKQHGTAALTLMNLACSCLELGLVSRALVHARASEALFDAVQQPHVAATIVEGAARVYAEVRALDSLDRVLHGLGHLQAGAAASFPATVKSQWLVAQSLRARLAGERDTARALLMQALAMGAAAGSPVRRARRLQLLLEFELQAGQADHLAAARGAAQALLLDYPDAELSAALRRTEASRHLAAGDIGAACASLRQIIDDTKPGRQHALARIDLAWLLLDEGGEEDVGTLLRPMGVWLDEHPVGRALARRLHAGPDAARESTGQLPSVSQHWNGP